MMTPPFSNDNLHRSNSAKNNPLPTEYLHYEWSKGYLPTENPKVDENDVPEERLK